MARVVDGGARVSGIVLVLHAAGGREPLSIPPAAMQTRGTLACQSSLAAGSRHYLAMPTQQLLDQVRELREAGRTPKEIARALRMPRAR